MMQVSPSIIASTTLFSSFFPHHHSIHPFPVDYQPPLSNISFFVGFFKLQVTKRDSLSFPLDSHPSHISPPWNPAWKQSKELYAIEASKHLKIDRQSDFHVRRPEVDRSSPTGSINLQPTSVKSFNPLAWSSYNCHAYHQIRRPLLVLDCYGHKLLHS